MRILIVDDHTMFREGLALLLRGLADDMQISSAGSCKDALDQLDADKAVDLVLMDLSLPDVQGFEGIQAVRCKYPEIPVVVLSASNDSKTVRRAIQEGAMGFIPKTHSADLLLGALRFILVHKGIYLPPDILLDSGETGLPGKATPLRPSQKETHVEDLGLTPRQSDVLHQLLEGKSNKAIARALHIEEPTVKAHVNAVLKALKVTTRTGAVIAAHQMRLVFGDRQDGSEPDVS